jgi:hypothetical protein
VKTPHDGKPTHRSRFEAEVTRAARSRLQGGIMDQRAPEVVASAAANKKYSLGTLLISVGCVWLSLLVFGVRLLAPFSVRSTLG